MERRVLIACALMQIVFILLKLDHLIAWSWWLVVGPLLAVPVAFVIGTGILFYAVSRVGSED